MANQAIQSSDTINFTYAWYESFLDRIRDAGYTVGPVAEGAGPEHVVLRHDVDLSVRDALRMARLEAAKGVSATYCLLLTSGLYNALDREPREQIREIEGLGHEVALHFSTHEYWDRDDEPGEPALRRRIDAERTALDTVRDEATDTVSFHSPPEWVLDRTIEGVDSTYAPRLFSEITYVADSGQRWRDAQPSIDAFGESAQVLTHPGLWHETDGSFEQRIQESVTAACRHSNAKAQREFVVEDF